MYNSNFIKITGAILLLFVIGTTVYSEILNPSFEMYEPNGDFNTPLDWNVINYADVVRSFIPVSIYSGRNINWLTDEITPYDGNSFILLSTGNMEPDPPYSEISQTVTFSAGQKLSGYYFFGTYDYLDFNDYAQIILETSLDSNLPDIIVAEVSVSEVGDFNSTDGWQYFEHIFTQEDAGTYDLVFTVVDIGDNIYPSFLAADYLATCDIAPYGDINTDCIVDFKDFTLFAQHWLDSCTEPDWCGNTDFDQSGTTDIYDMALFTDYWLWGY